MSEKLDKLRASLEKEKERRIKINNRIESLERRIQEAEAAEVNEMVRTAKVTPEQLAALRSKADSIDTILEKFFHLCGSLVLIVRSDWTHECFL